MENTIEVLGRNYYFAAHGKYPGGRGNWAFEIDGLKDPDGNPDLYWVNGLYSEAVKEAKKHARTFGARWIKVLT